MKNHYICFELTMPNCASWNGKWSGNDRKHYIIKTVNEKYFQANKGNLVGSWYYSWPDGWVALVTGTEIDGKESARRKRMKTGFCGYNWMVDSIIATGKILNSSELRKYLAAKLEDNP